MNYFLVSYQLNELKQKDKMKLLRGLYGYSNKKGSKVYFQKGMVEETKSKRVGINTILFSSKDFKLARDFFKKLNVKLEVMEVFVKGGV